MGEQLGQDVLGEQGAQDGALLQLVVDLLLESTATRLVFREEVGVVEEVKEFVFFRREALVEGVQGGELVGEEGVGGC